MSKNIEINKNIFQSKSEREFFYLLQKNWKKTCNIYPNQPYSLIFDIYNIDYDIYEKKLDFLKKTSIDYVICDKDDIPFLAIEFDGMFNGYNYGLEYSSRKKNKNEEDLDKSKLRKLKMETKLKIAKSINHKIPFFIIGYDEFINIEGEFKNKEHKYVFTKENKLTIADGIIGHALAKKQYRKSKKENHFNPEELFGSKEEYEEWMREDPINADSLIISHLKSEYGSFLLKNNPILRRSNELVKSIPELKGKILDFNIFESCRIYLPNNKEFRCKFLYRTLNYAYTMSGEENKLEKNSELIGYKCIFNSKELGKVEGNTIWIPNFGKNKEDIDVFPYERDKKWMDEIARIIVMEKYKALLN